ncbi:MULTISPECIES: NADP-dependent isocitrate dehydrogenase [Dermabacter]|uniref:Isocitrate dehydrogenase [NADP] n=1 Tax=Dermabacter vaginalis TaxID=1630135 RepID=A0A1B0ZGY9_9MICO|nr:MULTISPECIES: NADP-dependent isocitrate dehydrogenase [Dermabacter]ANP27249.1 isocitrate dehydrogenase, NADP-dependent [Dermabacter vaginalis]RUP86105.1 NADP-dependent isocitrate dehydrogenase [Dermabacter sp. HSID17554]
MSAIMYTITDEAPMLATASLLPIVRGFASKAGVDIETRDISLAARILAAFADRLPEDQRERDALAELGALARTAEANIIKLPNISASVPQLKAAIAELQARGYDLPDYPDSPETDTELDVRARYDAVKGSAVNPVLREGNSDRRAPRAVKNFAKAHPHRMGEWSTHSRTEVATMSEGDFRSSERSFVVHGDKTFQIVHVATDGTETILKNAVTAEDGDIIDASVMSIGALEQFLTAQIERARERDVLFSLHLKATMMKVSDPVIFGHAVRAFFPEVFTRFGAKLEDAGLSANNGLGAILSGLEALDAETAEAIRTLVSDRLAEGPELAMVDSDRGITNLHVPSDVIVDASMPAMIRTGGKMWGSDGAPHDTLAVIPDSSYAPIYQVVIDDCRRHGAFDPAGMGTVPNVGLMAQKAEEYGSHDKTFIAPADGRIEIRSTCGCHDAALTSHTVQAGDIFRACHTKDAPVRDWVALAVRRARLSNTPAFFWLDPERAHDREITAKVEHYLGEENTDGLDIRVLSPVEAMKETLERTRAGLDTISVTGNVLRDYLTDLFPIMELGTSAKMLSVVPLMAGGGLFETGAGGSAPKHVQQLMSENYLRWDSLGEFLALAESLRHLARHDGNREAEVLANALDRATETLLNEGKSPERRLGGIDNRGSHFFLALYWARELASQTDSPVLAETFAPVAHDLSEAKEQIEQELLEVQGSPAEIGGYYRPAPESTAAVMRPSATLNAIIDQLAAR